MYTDQQNCIAVHKCVYTPSYIIYMYVVINSQVHTSKVIIIPACLLRFALIMGASIYTQSMQIQQPNRAIICTSCVGHWLSLYVGQSYIVTHMFVPSIVPNVDRVVSSYLIDLGYSHKDFPVILVRWVQSQSYLSHDS